MAPSRAPKRWKPEGARSGLYGEQGGRVLPSSVIASCVFRFMCGCVAMLKEDFRNIFVRSNSAEEFLEGFKSLNVHI